MGGVFVKNCWNQIKLLLGLTFFKRYQNYVREKSKFYCIKGYVKNNVLTLSMTPYIEIVNFFSEVVDY